jgi:hypothetical protein
MVAVSYTKAQIDSLVEKFNGQTLPKSDWTHLAHLIVGISYLNAYSFYDAVCRLKSGIILLNYSQQTLNTDNSGYHETITIFWSKVIKIYISLHNNLSVEQLVNSFLSSSLADTNLPFVFYEKQFLLSPHCRTIYIEPQLQPLDTLTINNILNQTQIPNTIS